MAKKKNKEKQKQGGACQRRLANHYNEKNRKEQVELLREQNRFYKDQLESARVSWRNISFRFG